MNETPEQWADRMLDLIEKAETVPVTPVLAPRTGSRWQSKASRRFLYVDWCVGTTVGVTFGVDGNKAEMSIGHLRQYYRCS